MLFRVIYTTSLYEYYKENSNDIQFAITVMADSFKEAEAEAEGCLLDYLILPNLFEVVEIKRIDNI